MPKVKRQRIAHTEEWGILQQRTLWPEQEQYELIRPIVLFGDTPAERAEQTGAAERTLYRRVDRFDQEGMMSLFSGEQIPKTENARNVPAQCARPSLISKRNILPLLPMNWQRLAMFSLGGV